MVGTIREVHAKIQERGYLISECWIRERVKAGDIPHITAGKNRALISLEVLQQYIDSRVGRVQSE